MTIRPANKTEATPPDPTAAAPIRAWVEVLDELTYYELFGLAPTAGDDDVREAFHVFCDTFHPDRHFGRADADREGISAIFKRGTEAYLVLADAGLRGHYDAELAARPRSAPPTRIRFSSYARPPSMRPPGEVKLEDAARSPAARPFARRAEELIRKGDLRQAKLQLVMANHLDPDNEALAAAMRDLEARLKR
ncbi:MAG TPA: DnaJ domain-containing protein [Polyangiaceae bacterium]|nr:DnaJ domain-containing protein [Polyangiaceae bacterium]